MAPSLRPAALPAVTLPCGRNGVLSVASFSRLVSGRGASSTVARPQPVSGSRVATVTRSGCSLPAWYAFGGLHLRREAEPVGPLLGDAGQPVVQVLRGGAHDQRRRVDQLLGQDPRVGVDALAHRVAAHVLDAAGDRDVVGAEGDPAGDGGHRGHGAGAHAVDRVAGDGLGQTRQQGGGAADGQALVADLGGGRDGDLVDPLGRQLRVAAQQLADAADDEVVGAGVGVHPAGLAERGAHAVDEDDVADGTGHGMSS